MAAFFYASNGQRPSCNLKLEGWQGRNYNLPALPTEAAIHIDPIVIGKSMLPVENQLLADSAKLAALPKNLNYVRPHVLEPGNRVGG